MSAAAAVEALVAAVVIAPPRDSTLRTQWDGWVEAERRAFTARRNAAELASILASNGLYFRPTNRASNEAGNGDDDDFTVSSPVATAVESSNASAVSGDGAGGAIYTREAAAAEALARRRSSSRTEQALLAHFEATLGAAPLQRVDIAATSLLALKLEAASRGDELEAAAAIASASLASVSDGATGSDLSRVAADAREASPRMLAVGEASLELALAACCGALPSRLPGTPPSRSKEQVGGAAHFFF